MKRSLFIILLALGLATDSIHAAIVDYFLKLEGIEGEAQDARHKGEIEIISFNFGVTQSGGTASGGGTGAGKVVFSDTHFSMSASKASPKLMLACATGQHISSATFFIHRPGGDTNVYYKVVLQDVLVTSYQSGGSESGDIVPTDQFSLNFGQIKFEYTARDGSVTSGEAIRPVITQ